MRFVLDHAARACFLPLALIGLAGLIGPAAMVATIGIGATRAEANCSGNTLWAYDAAGHRLLTISTDGNATVQQVVAMSGGVGQLEGIAWNEAGTALFGLTQAGEAWEINVATGQLVGTSGNRNLAPGLSEDAFSLTMNDHGSAGRWVSAVTDPNTIPLPTIYLRELDPLNLPIELVSNLLSSTLYIGGIDTLDCNYTDYIGLTAGDVGTVRVFHWEESGGFYGWGQIDPVFISGERVDAAASNGGQIYTVGNIGGSVVRFAPRAGTFSAVIPQDMGTIGTGYDIRGLSFGPLPSGPTTTTTTSTTTSTTTTTTTTTTVMIPQTSAQIACITGVNKAGAKLAKARAKETVRCLKDRHAGNLATTTFSDLDLCIGADRNGKVTKSEAKLARVEQKKCQGPALPDYGYTSAALTDVAHELAPRTLAGSLLGVPTETAGAVGAANAAAADCQMAVVANANKLLDTKLSVFGKCKKEQLKNAVIVNEGGFAACLTALHVTTNGYGAKVAKKAASMAAKVAKACNGATTGTALPGRCAGFTGSTLTDCVDAAVECEACLALTAADGFTFDCDAFDDATLNSSCGF